MKKGTRIFFSNTSPFRLERFPTWSLLALVLGNEQFELIVSVLINLWIPFLEEFMNCVLSWSPLLYLLHTLIYSCCCCCCSSFIFVNSRVKRMSWLFFQWRYLGVNIINVGWCIMGGGGFPSRVVANECGLIYNSQDWLHPTRPTNSKNALKNYYLPPLPSPHTSHPHIDPPTHQYRERDDNIVKLFNCKRAK